MWVSLCIFIAYKHKGELKLAEDNSYKILIFLHIWKSVLSKLDLLLMLKRVSTKTLVVNQRKNIIAFFKVSFYNNTKNSDVAKVIIKMFQVIAIITTIHIHAQIWYNTHTYYSFY